MSSPFDPSVPPVLRQDDFRSYVPPVYVITPSHRRWWLHIVLFLLTVFTTLVMGARLQYNFANNLPPFRFDEDLFPVLWALRDPRNLLLGVPFSFTLMLILFAHEMGHYFYCLKYRVYATLPFFIPAPTLIGTFGAFIRIKSPIPTRRALFDIGIAGPIAGFIFALPAAVVGLLLSKHDPTLVQQSDLDLGYPLIFHFLHGVLPWASYGHAVPSIADLYLHPVALAAWIGMFATALNLLPGGQLDGGHIVFSVAPRMHRRVTRTLMFALLPLGFFFWQGWYVWAIFLLLMGSRHPQVSLFPELDARRHTLAILALVMLILTVVPAPFAGGSSIDAWQQHYLQR